MFIHYLCSNGVKHIQSAPYHHLSNGQAERFVQTLKRSLKVSKNNDKSLSNHLAKFSSAITLHLMLPWTNVSPGELFLKRSLQTRFDIFEESYAGGCGI